MADFWRRDRLGYSRQERGLAYDMVVGLVTDWLPILPLSVRLVIMMDSLMDGPGVRAAEECPGG